MNYSCNCTKHSIWCMLTLPSVYFVCIKHLAYVRSDVPPAIYSADNNWVGQLTARLFIFICSSSHFLSATTRLHCRLLHAPSHCVCLTECTLLDASILPFLALSVMAFKRRWRLFSRVWMSHGRSSSLNMSPFNRILLIVQERDTHNTSTLFISWWKNYILNVAGVWSQG